MALETCEDKNKKTTKKLQKSYFDVLGLCCSSEVPLIENILKSLDGVKDYTVIVPTRTVIVFHDDLLVSQLQIVKALNQARLEANIRVQGDASYQKKWPSPFAVLSGVLLLLSLLKFVYHPLHWLALGAVAVGIVPIILKAVASIRNVRLDTNILVLIAVIGTIALKDYIEAGTIVFLFTIAEWLESRASHKANAAMSSLMNMAPQKAVIAETGEEVDADEVKLNTVLAVKAGEVIPIDGVVVDGKSEVDEKTLTGESFPVPKQKDSTVWAGTMNLNGYISVKTTALAEDCVVAKMAKLVEEAHNSKSQTQRLIDKYAQYYTPAVIILSASFVLVPFILRKNNRNHWFHLALVVLVSACPCALILSTPVVTFCALTKAATSGLLIKGGDYLELLAKIKIIAFDKTGTITRGEFIVTDFQSLCSDFSLETLLYWVSSIESKSSHPMAAALVDYTRSFSIDPKPDDVEEFQNFPGEGIHGKIDGKDIYIGNRRIAYRAGCDAVPVLGCEAKRGTTSGYIYIGATACGIFSLSDACRTGVAEAIKDLKKLGIKTAMLTGDSQAAALHAQEQLGEHALEEVHAELLPENKATIVKSFKKECPTAMIGDGVNDAPALATADIGISMGISGSALATETGHVILMSNDIRKIPKAIQLARRARRKVIENVIVSISTKSVILAVAFAGHPLVWAAVLADVGTCLLVIFNSMLLLRGKHGHAGKCCKSSAQLHTHKHSDDNASHNHKKCCDSSAQLHAHKHSNDHTSHNHKSCCSKPKTESSCEHPQQFPTCNSKCQPNHHNSAKMPKADVHKHETKQCCDLGGCETNSHHDIQANKEDKQCCNHDACGTKNRRDIEANNQERHGGCKTNNQHDIEANNQETQCCDHGRRETNDQHAVEANNQEKHCHSSDHENMSSCQSQVHRCQNSGEVVKHVHSHCKTDTHHGISHHSVEVEEQNMRNHSNCHSHNKSSSLWTGNANSCRCYVKKCCGNHGEHGTGIGGGLSEITIA